MLPMFAALLLAACSVNRRTLSSKTQVRADTVSHAFADAGDVVRQTNIRTRNHWKTHERMIRSELAEPIPARTASVNLTAANLRNLPDGASYVARDGRLTLEARRDGDTLRIVAHADSLARRTVRHEYRQCDSMVQDTAFRRILDSLARTCERVQRTTRGTESQAAEERSRKPAHLLWLSAALLAAGLAGWWRVHRK